MNKMWLDAPYCRPTADCCAAHALPQLPGPVHPPPHSRRRRPRRLVSPRDRRHHRGRGAAGYGLFPRIGPNPPSPHSPPTGKGGYGVFSRPHLGVPNHRTRFEPPPRPRPPLRRLLRYPAGQGRASRETRKGDSRVPPLGPPSPRCCLQSLDRPLRSSHPRPASRPPFPPSPPTRFAGEPGRKRRVLFAARRARLVNRPEPSLPWRQRGGEPVRSAAAAVPLRRESARHTFDLVSPVFRLFSSQKLKTTTCYSKCAGASQTGNDWK